MSYHFGDTTVWWLGLDMWRARRLGVVAHFKAPRDSTPEDLRPLALAALERVSLQRPTPPFPTQGGI